MALDASGSDLADRYLERQRARPRMLRWIPTNAHPYAWAALGVTWGIWTMNAFDFALVSVLAPSIITEFGISATFFGNAVALLLLARAAVDLPISALSDRLGSGWRRRTLWAPIVVFYALVSTLTAIKSLSSAVYAFFFLRGAVNVGGVACETIGVTATSEPEPDVALFPPGGYRGSGHPTTATLLIEVSNSSLRRDLILKARIYAQGGVPDYWVVDLVHREVVVHRSPTPDGYAEVTRHREGSITSLHHPGLAVDLAALFT